jgi:hypothetical protein
MKKRKRYGHNSSHIVSPQSPQDTLRLEGKEIWKGALQQRDIYDDDGAIVVTELDRVQCESGVCGRRSDVHCRAHVRSGPADCVLRDLCDHDRVLNCEFVSKEASTKIENQKPSSDFCELIL